MSIQIKGPSGNWSAVSAPVDYAGVVSNYAAAFQQAQIQQEDAQIELKIQQYKQGLLTYSDLTTYLDGVKSAYPEGAVRRLDLEKVGLELQGYEDEKNIDLKRAELETKYAKGGISASERVDIEEEVLDLMKEGTVQFAEQQSVIAKAKELEDQEDKNKQIAELESKLSKGGITTGEQIQILEKALSLTDQDSEDYSKLTTEINKLKETKRLEDKEKAMNQELSSMLDQYVGGGLSDQELLAINKKMQGYAEPGTSEYINLKEQEAKILDSMAKGSGAGSESTLNSAFIDLERLEAENDKLQSQFQIGAISEKDYAQKQSEILGQENELLNSLGDAVTSDRTLSRFAGQLQAKTQDFEALSKALQEGQAVTVKIGKKQALVPLSEAASYAELYDVADTSDLDEQGNPTNYKQRQVITLNINGKEKKFMITDEGRYEQLRDSPATILDANGKEVPVFVGTGLQLETFKDPLKDRISKFTGALTNKQPGFGEPQGASLQQRIGEAAQMATKKTAETAAGIQAKLGPTVSNIGKTVSDLTKKVQPTLSKAAGSGLLGPAGMLASSISNLSKNKAQISSGLSNFTSKFAPTANKISSGFNNLVSQAKTAGSNLLSKIKGLFS